MRAHQVHRLIIDRTSRYTCHSTRSCVVCCLLLAPVRYFEWRMSWLVYAMPSQDRHRTQIENTFDRTHSTNSFRILVCTTLIDDLLARKSIATRKQCVAWPRFFMRADRTVPGLASIIQRKSTNSHSSKDLVSKIRRRVRVLGKDQRHKFNSGSAKKMMLLSSPRLSKMHDFDRGACRPNF